MVVPMALCSAGLLVARMVVQTVASTDHLKVAMMALRLGNMKAVKMVLQTALPKAPHSVVLLVHQKVLPSVVQKVVLTAPQSIDLLAALMDHPKVHQWALPLDNLMVALMAHCWV